MFKAGASEIIYHKLVEADPSAAGKDSIIQKGLSQAYNGVPTITAKTKIALQRASGIMIWTVEYDAPGEASLLNAIHATLDGNAK